MKQDEWTQDWCFVLDARGETIGSASRPEVAAKIVSDHNSVIKLLEALHDARHQIASLEAERSARQCRRRM